MSRLKDNVHKILNRGTEFLGLDLKYFVSGGFWKTIGTATTNILAAFLMIAFANFLPKETYGLYRYILSLIGILTMFSLTGMNVSVTQAVAAGNEGALKASVKYQLKWNLLMIFASWTLAAYYLLQQNTDISIALFILGFITPFTYTFNTYGAYLEGKKDFKRKSIFLIWSSIIYVAGMLPAIYFGKKMLWLIAAYAITSFLSNLIFYIKTLKIYNPPKNKSPEAITYGRHLTYLNFINPILGQADNIILAHFWGVGQLAVYSLARVMPDKIGPFIKQIIGVGLPKLAQKTVEDIEKVFYKRLLQTALLGAIVAAGYILLAPVVFKYLMPKYLDSVFYSQLLATTFIFAASIGYIGTAMTAQKMMRPIVLGSISSSIIKIILYIVLGIWGGIFGLVLAQVIYYIIVFFISIALWKFKSPVD